MMSLPQQTLAGRLFQKSGKPLVVKFAGCHLDADAFGLSHKAGAKMFNMQGDAVILAEFLDKMFVSQVLLAPQMKIVVGGLNGVTQFLQGNQ